MQCNSGTHFCYTAALDGNCANRVPVEPPFSFWLASFALFHWGVAVVFDLHSILEHSSPNGDAFDHNRRSDAGTFGALQEVLAHQDGMYVVRDHHNHRRLKRPPRWELSLVDKVLDRASHF